MESDHAAGMSGFCIKAGNDINTNNVVVRGGNTTSTGTKCGRWNPTSEQVKVLTDLFRSGLQTPSTDQIQKISNQLSFYGKIESKNVFYWFQNHKARDRQKRRKVSIDDNFNKDNNLILSEDKINIPSPKDFAEIYHHYHHHHHQHHQHHHRRHRYHDYEDPVSDHEPERVIETLQLFPTNSFGDADSEKLRRCKVTTAFPCTFQTDQMDHPPLDLRLSFI